MTEEAPITEYVEDYGDDYVLDYAEFNPNAFHLLNAMQDESLRTIIMYGGSSSGKSYSVAQIMLVMTMYDRENTLVMRKVSTSIVKSIYEDFKVAARQLGVSQLFRFKESTRQIVCDNGARIDFSGLDDPEKIKGISNYKRIVLDEWSEFEEEDHKQIRKRLRGKRGQQIVTTFNPIKETHWIKRNVFDAEEWHDVPMELCVHGVELSPELCQVKSLRKNAAKTIFNPVTREYEEHAPDMLVIQSTYLNNFWVVGSPDGTYGYYDEQCIADFEKDRVNDPDYYNVYALGEWGVIRTGSEFFGSFNRGVHTGPTEYDPELPVHLSIDSNVMPYISITYWQVHTDGKVRICQIGETCSESPNNSARKSAKLVAARLREMGVGKVYLHGDASTRAANTIDDDKRSFLDLFISTLQSEHIEVEDKVGNRNPNVAMTGEFINAIFDGIFDGIEIMIGEQCKTSIEDYMSVQKDMNGAILKTKVKNRTTGQSYEEHGHLSDCFRYVVADVCREDFIVFANRRKRNLYARDGAIHYYNPETQCAYTEGLVYAMPNINGRFVMVHGRKCGDRWHIVDARLADASSSESILAALSGCDGERTILECSKNYYMMARELRDKLTGDVRVLHEDGDLQRRIAATSDFVKDNVLFRETEDSGYAEFMTNVFDYNRESRENYEGSACLSGFVQAVLKLDL